MQTIRKTTGADKAWTRIFPAAAWAAHILLAPIPGQAAAHESVAMEVTPKICVTRGEQACSMDLEITWAADSPQDLCLRLVNTGAQLECWQQAREGRFLLRYDSLEDVALQLVNGALAVLGETEVKVVSRDLRDSRRRRRHVWSIL